MKTLREPLTFLSGDEMDILHSNALRILSDTGMRIDHDEALERLAAAGCRVDHGRRIVKFPPSVVQGSVDRLRDAFSRRVEPAGMAVRYSHVRFRREEFTVHEDFAVSAGGYCVFIHDLDGVRRPAILEDARAAIRLADRLDQVRYTGLPVAAQDVPLPLRQVMMAAELVKNTDKLGGIEALTPFDIEYICRIAEVVRGSRAELLRNPVLVGYAEARTPLCIDRAMCEVMIEYVKRGMPQSLDTMPNAGVTAPIHPAGALALGLAETLGGLVLAHSIDPNACVTIDVTPSFGDPGTGIFKYAGAERVSLIGARIQMIGQYYGCPSGVHGGKTDALVPDVRCGMEKGISMLMPILCGAIGFGTIGHLENAVTFSPLQLVMDNEIVRYVRRAIRGFAVTDQTINASLIDSVGIGGNYLATEDTAEKYRDCLLLSSFLAAEPWGALPRADERKRWDSQARSQAEKLLAAEREPPLRPEQEREVDRIVAAAAAALGVTVPG